MSSNFNINPNFKLDGFNNSIDDFNKIFSNSANKADTSFNEIFNSISPSAPLQAGVSQFVGMDSINAQKISDISEVAKVAKDIGTGFSDSLSQLSNIDKKAEQDFETFASGGDISVHDVMISAQKSNLAMQMAIQLRNQMLNAYNEFKNMSI